MFGNSSDRGSHLARSFDANTVRLEVRIVVSSRLVKRLDILLTRATNVVHHVRSVCTVLLNDGQQCALILPTLSIQRRMRQEIDLPKPPPANLGVALIAYSFMGSIHAQA
jgi:hypothetical protein